ncbi:hypothetical protein BDN72DRAFT_900433 [Pluteus cervinus]|uniref:Uncharacterized protein n=1 Tax=Pluteus cervinus TaxID=181527 RepID=A0ACD3ALF6_9AGAR|nr:hypothetical protein BDN72DRAFT_900433 [Pluteus cervinus]
MFSAGQQMGVCDLSHFPPFSPPQLLLVRVAPALLASSITTPYYHGANNKAGVNRLTGCEARSSVLRSMTDDTVIIQELAFNATDMMNVLPEVKPQPTPCLPLTLERRTPGPWEVGAHVSAAGGVDNVGIAAATIGVGLSRDEYQVVKGTNTSRWLRPKAGPTTGELSGESGKSRQVRNEPPSTSSRIDSRQGHIPRIPCVHGVVHRPSPNETESTADSWNVLRRTCDEISQTISSVMDKSCVGLSSDTCSCHVSDRQ